MPPIIKKSKITTYKRVKACWVQNPLINTTGYSSKYTLERLSNTIHRFKNKNPIAFLINIYVLWMGSIIYVMCECYHRYKKFYIYTLGWAAG